MAYTLWSQDVFSKGELSPYMYARVTVNQYLEGLKTAQNVLTFPTGASGKRFGTLFQNFLTGFTSAKEIYFDTFQYVNECVYQLVFSPLLVSIYLEGTFVNNVSTSLNAAQIAQISSTTLGAAFRIATFGTKPYQLTRSANAANPLVSTALNVITVSGAALPVGVVLPVQFTTSGSLPTSNPQIYAGVTYFVFTITSTTVKVYATSQDAKFQTNEFTISSVGASSNLIVYNTWAFNAVVFKNTPAYDFNGALVSYDGCVFTPAAATGTNITVNVAPPYSKLDSSYVGGTFIAGSGSARIISVASTASFNISIQNPFEPSTGYQGSLVFLAEPAWSDARGWPQVCSSYQNRALFANTVSLSNGFWASTINDYSDFSDLTGDDDDAISWYPSSNNINFIKFIVPYRSLTVHTNTGIYSSPLSDLAAITPSNFTLQLQDSTPADTLLPQAIDNQVVVLSGNDAHQMVWDGINNAYTSNIISVISEHLIRNPVDEVGFADLRRAGSRYIFIINENGSMAIFQTLIAESVSGFTPAIMEQTYGNASFRQAASSVDGRCWFVCEREIATAGSPEPIVGFGGPGNIQLVVSNLLSTTIPTAIKFTTTGSLPTATPPLNTNDYFWAIAITGNAIQVYVTQEDALANTNAIVFSNAGVNSNIVPWPATTKFTLEELTEDTFLDCAVYFNNNGSPLSTISTGILFNAQDVKMVGDGFGFDAEGDNNEVIFEAHGVLTPVDEGYIGFAINTIMEPMPLTIAQGGLWKTTSLTKPKHVRSVRFWFNNTIGGEINGVPIAIKTLDQADPGEPPIPANGIVELMIMKGWDDINNPTYTITHSDPFNIQLLGVFYSVDV